MNFDFWTTKTGKELNAYISQIKVWMVAVLVIGIGILLTTGLTAWKNNN